MHKVVYARDENSRHSPNTFCLLDEHETITLRSSKSLMDTCNDCHSHHTRRRHSFEFDITLIPLYLRCTYHRTLGKRRNTGGITQLQFRNLGSDYLASMFKTLCDFHPVWSRRRVSVYWHWRITDWFNALVVVIELYARKTFVDMGISVTTTASNSSSLLRACRLLDCIRRDDSLSGKFPRCLLCAIGLSVGFRSHPQSH